MLCVGKQRRCRATALGMIGCGRSEGPAPPRLTPFSSVAAPDCGSGNLTTRRDCDMLTNGDRRTTLPPSSGAHRPRRSAGESFGGREVSRSQHPGVGTFHTYPGRCPRSPADRVHVHPGSIASDVAHAQATNGKLYCSAFHGSPVLLSRPQTASRCQLPASPRRPSTATGSPP